MTDPSVIQTKDSSEVLTGNLVYDVQRVFALYQKVDDSGPYRERWYEIDCQFNNGQHWLLRRHPGEFEDLRTTLLESLHAIPLGNEQKNILPPVVRTIMLEDLSRSLNDFLEKLLALKLVISTSYPVLHFFTPRIGDIPLANISHDDANGAANDNQTAVTGRSTRTKSEPSIPDQAVPVSAVTNSSDIMSIEAIIAPRNYQYAIGPTGVPCQTHIPIHLPYTAAPQVQQQFKTSQSPFSVSVLTPPAYGVPHQHGNQVLTADRLHIPTNKRRKPNGPSISDISRQQPRQMYSGGDSPQSTSLGYGEESKEGGRCPNPGCGKPFKDLKTHMLTHQAERPEKCPVATCEYHIKGFARVYDKQRHTLSHFKGTMVCGFCPGSGSSAEKSFNRTDVFKRHLNLVHGVEQSPPNSRKKSSSLGMSKKATNFSNKIAENAKCSTCSHIFKNAQKFYEHLDDCVLSVVQQEESSEAINEKALTAISRDPAVQEALERNNLPNTFDYQMPSDKMLVEDEKSAEDRKAKKVVDPPDTTDNAVVIRSLEDKLTQSEKMYSDAKLQFYAELALIIQNLEDELVQSQSMYLDAKVQHYAKTAKPEETDSSYQGELERLGKNYEVAANYVKGAEKLLKNMKDPPESFKDENLDFKADLGGSQDSDIDSSEQGSNVAAEKLEALTIKARHQQQRKGKIPRPSRSLRPKSSYELKEPEFATLQRISDLDSNEALSKSENTDMKMLTGFPVESPTIKQEATEFPTMQPAIPLLLTKTEKFDSHCKNSDQNEFAGEIYDREGKGSTPTTNLYLRTDSRATSPYNPHPPSSVPKNVAFELQDNGSSSSTARLPMRVQIFPHDTTDSIVTTVINFYGLYECATEGVSFEDSVGNTLIARYENVQNNMTVYVRAMRPDKESKSETYMEGTCGDHDTPIQALKKRKAPEEITRDFKRHFIPETEHPVSISILYADDLADVRRGECHSPNASFPSRSDSDLVLQASSDADTSETDFELIDANGDNQDSAGISHDDFFGQGEERIINPKEYFKKLEAIEEKVALNSALRYWQRACNLDGYYCNSGTNGRCCHGRTVFTNNTSGSSGPCLPRRLPDLHNSDNRWAVLVEYRNRLARVLFNAKMMRDTGYSKGSFNLLVLDCKRTTVAQLRSFELADIIQLFEAFEVACETMESSDGVNLLITSDVEQSIDALTTKCAILLDKIELGPMESLKWDCLKLWRNTVQVLDFALLSYAGAHLEAFDERYLGQRFRSFHLHAFLILRRRRLQCLDEFLGHQDVWVFHPYSVAPSLEENARLLLSTSIDTMADVWGPMWKIVRKSGTGIVEYNIGNGMIVPWRQDNSTSNLVSPLVEHNEKYCHWISARKYRVENVRSHQVGISSYFDGTETLLIGAVEAPKISSDSVCRSSHKDLGLQVNMACKLSCEDLLHIKDLMKNKGALREPMTKNSRRYKDSHAIQVQGSAMGFVSLADTITYKRRLGHSMKDALVERWRNGPRKFSELASCSGVEVSLCTQNARRRRLLDILRTGTVRKYLDSISFTWPSEKFQQEYFDSLGDPKSFRRLWNRHSARRSCIIEAISTCFDALQETGIDEDNGELSALWVESFEEEESDGEDFESLGSSDEDHTVRLRRHKGSEQSSRAICHHVEDVEDWIVTLYRSEHTWTGLLRDSTTCLTMAVVNDTCLSLENTDGYGRQCQSRKLSGEKRKDMGKWKKKQQAGFSVLQTALLLNESILKDEGLKREGRAWVFKDVKKKTRFDLGEQGHLTVVSDASKSQSASFPLVMEWSPVKSKRWQELKNVSVNEDLLGKNPDKHHQEYIRGKWVVDPLPVLVLSESNKILLRSSKDR